VSEARRIPESPRRAPTRLRPVRDWGPPIPTTAGQAYLVPLSQAREIDAWPTLWDGQRHDHRYADVVDGTAGREFDCRYLVLEDASGVVRGIQPVFACSQNVLEGIQGKMGPALARLGRLVPGVFALRTLMVGSPVGEGVLSASAGSRRWCAWALTQALPAAAKRLGASLIVLKEFPSDLRPELDVFRERGYARIPSLPYVALDLDFRTFDEHLGRLSKNARKDYRKKIKDAGRFPPLEMAVTDDITPRLDALYPLYRQVHDRASLRFETLTPEYFARLGREMSDRARFFIWSQQGRPVGFYSCIVHDGVLWIDTIGMDYAVALDLHLYFLMKRDVIEWACRNGLQRYCGGPLNYEPKLHLGCRLQPMDLYASHVNPFLNGVLRRFAPYLSPARYEPILDRFPNADEL
jgi:hypothetical protein